MTVGVIMNPVAGGGRLKQEWPGIRAELEARIGVFELRETGEPGDAAIFAHAFALSGFEKIIAVGGDGTVGEVVDGLLMAREEGAGKVELGVVPCGSGSDFARGLGLPLEPLAAARRFADGEAHAIDVGRVCYVGETGRLASRHFVNIASLGISGPIARAVNDDRRKERVSAEALFYWRTVSELVRYRFRHVRITIDDQPPFEARVALVAASNGKFFGGGMMIAPDAAPDDGLLDVVVLSSASKPRLIWDLRLVYGGRHRHHPAITILRGRRISVEPLGDPPDDCALVEVDGECPGHIPATFEILPKALTLRY
ncbi:diacylglycerol/lipid kinase family protein [Arvimicrobium flavum]|uniref:diacylglycerol/lipid kinase family protein n=1 Tax=Arvimicrobium flavum TaxID=3393320 RepID=UPI00237C383A|nr:diacylglycerol kinase family protein [Mesorhizobium shangrilense]